MKNIYTLPTYKPSRLTKALHYSNVLRLVHQNYKCDVKDEQYQHIYITSDEEIKVGDWFLHTSYGSTSIQKALEVSNHILDNQGMISNKENNLKIILTDNKDLIKDGVQAIDDEFLEWFVKNPSCEKVEISLEETQYGSGIYEYVIYKKEIPKEETKQETLTNDTDSHSWGFENFEVIKTEEDAKIFVETMENIPEANDKLKKAFRDFNKQETLEEAKVNNLIKLFGKDYDLEPRCVIESCNDSLIYGVEWQQEQNKNLYSEEEVRRMFDRYNEVIAHRDIEEWQPWIDKQLKNKMKNKETLEEAAETKLYQTINKIIDGGKDLQKGYNVTRGQAVDYAFEIALKVAKWQQEQDKKLYSEEDLEKAYKDGGRNEYDFINKYHCKARISFDKWFEQFKKK